MEKRDENIIAELHYPFPPLKRTVYTIPGYSNSDYRISTPRPGTLLFYEGYHDKYLYLYGHKPILLVYNINILF